MHTSTQESSPSRLRRGVVLVMAVVATVVAVAVWNNFWHHSVGAVPPPPEREALVGAAPNECLQAVDRGDVVAHGNIALGYADENGSPKVARLGQVKTLKSYLGLGQTVRRRSVKKVGQTLVVKMDDGSVVTLDAITCKVDGIFLGSDAFPNKIDRMVNEHLMRRPKQDLRRCSNRATMIKNGKKCFIWCPPGLMPNKNGVTFPVCLSESMDIGHGWRFIGPNQGTACDCDKGRSPKCSSLGDVPCKLVKAYGKCLVYSGVKTGGCNFKKMQQLAPMINSEVRPARAVTEWINDPRSSLPPAFMTLLGMEQATFNIKEHVLNARAMRPQWMAKMKQLRLEFPMLGSCFGIDFHVDKNKGSMKRILEYLNSVQNSLDPTKLARGTPQARISSTHLPNQGRCRNIAREIVAQSRNELTNARTVLPVAVRATVLCTSAYAEAGLDFKRAKRFAGGLRVIYTSVTGTIFEKAVRGFRFIQSHYGAVQRCGFFPAHKQAFTTVENGLRKGIVQPVGKLALAFHKNCMEMKNTKTVGSASLKLLTNTNLAQCQHKCAHHRTCNCYHYVPTHNACWLHQHCDLMKGRSDDVAGICKKHRAVIHVHIWEKADHVAPKCDEIDKQCRGEAKCVGVTTGCEMIRSGEQARTAKVAKVMLKDAVVSQQRKWRVDRARSGLIGDMDSGFVVEDWGACLAACADVESDCVAADVEEMQGKSEKVKCHLYSSHERSNLVLVEDSAFTHFDFLRGVDAML